MLALTVLLSLSQPAAAVPPQATEPAKPARPICQRGTQPAVLFGAPGNNRTRKLSEMPPARQIKTVLQAFPDANGCNVPLIVRENIGGD